MDSKMAIIDKATATESRKTADICTAVPVNSVNCSVMEWLQGPGRHSPDLSSLLDGLAHRLVAAGVPLARQTIFLRTLHPQISASSYRWKDNDEGVVVLDLDHDSQNPKAFQTSPIKLAFEENISTRRRLLDPECPRDFPILTDLDEEGITDYLVLPLPFSDGRRYASTWATKSPAGFSDGDLERIAALIPMLSLVVEVLAIRQITENLMDTYLGRKTGLRVLNGAIRRGSNESIEAAIWLSDLRGFTALADSRPVGEVIDLLNDHFEQVVGPVHAHGGEVLKFMGDAVLAIFPVAEFPTPDAACAAALAALREAEASTTARNAERETAGLPLIRFGVALHMGEVSYGNIGGLDRLDFTVIGPAINHTQRIAGMCRPLDRTVLASDTFARFAPEPLASLGFHALKGVRRPRELFALEAA
jgi:adenylate cyclase